MKDCVNSYTQHLSLKFERANHYQSISKDRYLYISCFQFKIDFLIDSDIKILRQNVEKLKLRLHRPSEKELADKLYDIVTRHYKEKIEKNAILAYPVIKDVYENEGDRYERIVVPFTDGIKTLQVVTDLQKAYDSGGKQLINDFEKNITLAIVDDSWKTHLRKMDELKQSVQNATYEQKDPLLIYKFESFELFKKMAQAAV